MLGEQHHLKAIIIVFKQEQLSFNFVKPELIQFSPKYLVKFLILMQLGLLLNQHMLKLIPQRILSQELLIFSIEVINRPMSVKSQLFIQLHILKLILSFLSLIEETHFKHLLPQLAFAVQLQELILVQVRLQV